MCLNGWWLFGLNWLMLFYLGWPWSYDLDLLRFFNFNWLLDFLWLQKLYCLLSMNLCWLNWLRCKGNNILFFEGLFEWLLLFCFIWLWSDQILRIFYIFRLFKFFLWLIFRSYLFFKWTPLRLKLYLTNFFFFCRLLSYKTFLADLLNLCFGNHCVWFLLRCPFLANFRLDRQLRDFRGFCRWRWLSSGIYKLPFNFFVSTCLLNFGRLLLLGSRFWLRNNFFLSGDGSCCFLFVVRSRLFRTLFPLFPSHT